MNHYYPFEGTFRAGIGSRFLDVDIAVRVGNSAKIDLLGLIGKSGALGRREMWTSHGTWYFLGDDARGICTWSIRLCLPVAQLRGPFRTFCANGNVALNSPHGDRMTPPPPTGSWRGHNLGYGGGGGKLGHSGKMKSHRQLAWELIGSQV